MKSIIILTRAFLALLFLIIHLTCLAGGPEHEGIPITSSSKEAVRIFEKGREAFDMGRIADAKSLFMLALLKDDQFASAWLYKAFTSNSDQEMKRNIEKARRLVVNNSEGEKILVGIAFTYLENQPEIRLQLAQRLVDIYPQSAHARLLLATEYQVRGDIGKFRDLAYEAIRAEPNSPLGYRALAASWLLNEPADFQLAKKYMKKFVELRPEEASAYLALGDVYRANLDLEKACTAYSHARDLAPTSTVANSKLGYVQTYLGKFEEARDNLEEANAAANHRRKEPFINSSTTSYLFHYNKEKSIPESLPSPEGKFKRRNRIPLDGPSDNCYFCRTAVAMVYGFFVHPENQPVNACLCLQNQLEQESHVPDKATVEANIAFVRALRSIQQTDYEQAKREANTYAQLINPIVPPVKIEAYNFLMGLIYLNTESYSKALSSFKKSDIQNPCVQYNMGLTYDKLQLWEQAEKIFTEVASCRFANATSLMMVKRANDWMESYEAIKLASQ